MAICWRSRIACVILCSISRRATSIPSISTDDPDDPDDPTVFYFLDKPMAYKLHVAGRLDIDTTGLVLMTDDGQWLHRVTSLKHHYEKTYLVTLEHSLAANTAQDFAASMQLHNEKSLTRPA